MMRGSSQLRLRNIYLAKRLRIITEGGGGLKFAEKFIKYKSTISDDFLKDLNLPNPDVWDAFNKPTLALDKNDKIVTKYH